LILTVTLTLAVDVTYGVDRIRTGETTRVSTVEHRAGGKGVNVARVLHALGQEVACAALRGVTRERAVAALHPAGIRDETVTVAGESRLTVMVVDGDGAATGFSEAGPTVSAGEWGRLRTRLRGLVPHAEALVLSGSVPPGTPPDGYGQLVAAAVQQGIPALLDAGGNALLAGSFDDAVYRRLRGQIHAFSLSIEPDCGDA